MPLIQFLAQNCLTLALAPVHLRESDLAWHLSSVLNLKIEIYGSLWKYQCFKQICHSVHHLPWECLWFSTDSWLLTRKTGNWEGFVWRKKKSSYRITLSKILWEDTSLWRLGVYRLSNLALSSIDLVDFFLQHGPQITSWSDLGS